MERYDETHSFDTLLNRRYLMPPYISLLQQTTITFYFHLAARLPVLPRYHQTNSLSPQEMCFVLLSPRVWKALQYGCEVTGPFDSIEGVLCTFVEIDSRTQYPCATNHVGHAVYIHTIGGQTMIIPEVCCAFMKRL